MAHSRKWRIVKEDVLEQIVDDYLQWLGYLTTHNVRFKPSKEASGFDSRLDSVASDVDVVGFHPKKKGFDRVAVVSCKAWQYGFDAQGILRSSTGRRRIPSAYASLQFRELWLPKWADAFFEVIESLTGTSKFTYYLAVTRLRNGNCSGR